MSEVEGRRGEGKVFHQRGCLPSLLTHPEQQQLVMCVRVREEKRLFSAQRATHSWQDDDYSFQTEKEGKERTGNYLLGAPAAHPCFAFLAHTAMSMGQCCSVKQH